MMGGLDLPGGVPKPLGSSLRTCALSFCSGHPPRESAGHNPAAEGATGPRKRSGTKDRSGQGSLESRTARKREVRTDGVKGPQGPRISQVP